MSALAHVFEQAGLTTIAFASMLPVVEKMKPPRALYCDFPLGWPLGKPSDVEFQMDVLHKAFATLDATESTIAQYPESIVATEEPLSCAMPPRFNPDALPAVDEAQGIRAAYDRSLAKRGSTSVGRTISVDEIPQALETLAGWVNGDNWKENPLPAKNTIGVAHDIRTYYEEAALELVTGPVPGGRAAEAWYFEQTEAGKLILQARKAMKAQEAPHPFWFYMAPAHR